MPDLISPRVQPRWLAAVHAIRVHQWVKNLLLFVPVILDHKLFDGATLAKAGIGFTAFCLAASGGYILNDMLDLEADRRHPTKRDRPFASGALPPALGVALSPLLMIGAVWLSWVFLPPRFVAALLLYLLLTTAYSSYLKRIAVLDVLLLAGLYTLRVLAGVAAAHVRFSTWLLAFSMFLFLSLAFLKRYAEISGLEPDADDQVRRRGYLRGDREWLGSMVTGGIVQFDPSLGTYELPPEHAGLLTRLAVPINFASAMQWIAVLGGVDGQLSYLRLVGPTLAFYCGPFGL